MILLREEGLYVDTKIQRFTFLMKSQEEQNLESKNMELAWRSSSY